MKKRFIITESEKNEIRKMYGLLRESPEDEIKAYLDYYLANRTCDQIAGDFESYQKTEDYKKLSKEEKDMIEKAITGLKNPTMATTKVPILNPNPVPCGEKEDPCQCVKNFMRSELLKQLSTNKEQVMAQVCIIQSIYPPQTPLTFCGNSGDKTDKGNEVKIDQNQGDKTDGDQGVKTDGNQGVKTDGNQGVKTDGGQGSSDFDIFMKNRQNIQQRGKKSLF